MAYKRSLWKLLSQNQFAPETTALAEAGIGGQSHTFSATAPAPGEALALPHDLITEDSLSVYRDSDNALYEPGVDFEEGYTQAGGAAMVNLLIAEGEAIWLSYLSDGEQGQEAAVEGSTPLDLDAGGGWSALAGYGRPASYKDRERVYLSGELGGGLTATGTVLFRLPPDHRPESPTRLTVMTSNGPTPLILNPEGAASIGDGPTIAGSEWLSLGGASFRAGIESPVVLDLDVFPSEDLMPSNVLFPNQDYSLMDLDVFPSEILFSSNDLFPNEQEE